MKRSVILLMSTVLALMPVLSANAQFATREVCSLLERRYADGYCLDRVSSGTTRTAATVTATGIVIHVERNEFTSWPSAIVYTAYVGIPSDCVASCEDDLLSMLIGTRIRWMQTAISMQEEGRMVPGLETYLPSWRDLLLVTVITSQLDTRYSYLVGNEDVAANYTREIQKAIDLLENYAAGADSQI